MGKKSFKKKARAKKKHRGNTELQKRREDKAARKAERRARRAEDDQ